MLRIAILLVLATQIISCSCTDLEPLSQAKLDGQALFRAIDTGDVIKRAIGTCTGELDENPSSSTIDTTRCRMVGVYPESFRTLGVRFVGYSTPAELKEMQRVLEAVHFGFSRIKLEAYRGVQYKRDASKHTEEIIGHDLLMTCTKTKLRGTRCWYPEP